MPLLLVERGASAVTSRLPNKRAVVTRLAMPDDALSMLRHDSFDLIVIDMVSLGESGFKFLRSVRTAQDQTPVIAVTNRQSGDRVRALSLGADEAIDHNIEFSEFHARMLAVVRRHHGYSQSVFEAGLLTICLESREVRFRGRRIYTTVKEFVMLELLILRRGQIVSKDMFLNHLYGGVKEPAAKIIDAFICKLRKKLVAASTNVLIRNVWGQGYVLRVSG